MKIASEIAITGSTNTNFPSSYDSTKINLGPLMRQYTGTTSSDNYLSTVPVSVSRNAEVISTLRNKLIHVLTWSSTIDWIFLGDLAAATTLGVAMLEYNKTTGIYTLLGAITLTMPTATVHTLRGFMVTRDTYSTGTVAVTGTTVTGTSTLWLTNNISQGARIGFGTTDPTLVTTWYEVSSVGSDTSITLLSSVSSTLGAGTAYVIEEIRIVLSTTNATTTNGGLFLVKGLNPSVFQITPVVIGVGAVDNIRAIYWLADAATVTNITAGGIGYESKVDNSNHFVYVTDGAATTLKIFKYNIRATLASIVSGKTTSGFVLATGNQSVTGNLAQNNNGRVATLSHGTGSGVACMYIVTTTRVTRVALSNITSGSTTFISDSMVEVPPGGINTFPAQGAMAGLAYLPSIDRLAISNTGAGGGFNYCTRYYNTSTNFDHFFLLDTKQTDGSIVDTRSSPIPSPSTNTMNIWEENGVAHSLRTANTTTTNQLYSIPVGAHWTYAATTGNRIITPAIATTGATKFYSIYVNSEQLLNNDNFGMQLEPYRVYVRISGISDNSGAWTLVSDTGDLSGLSASDSIQFMFEFRIMGFTSVPARIFGLTVLYESSGMISPQFQWNLSDSSNIDGTVGFIQVSTLGGTVPTIQIGYYRSDTNALVFSQASTGTTNGSFQYYNGSSWVSGTGTDTIGLRRRFVPTASFPVGVDTYPKVLI